MYFNVNHCFSILIIRYVLLLTSESLAERHIVLVLANTDANDTIKWIYVPLLLSHNSLAKNNDIVYNVGDTVETYCIQIGTKVFQSNWFHGVSKQKQVIGFMPQCSKRTCVSKMTLEWFDNGTHLLCCVSNGSKHHYSNSFSLRQNDTQNILQLASNVNMEIVKQDQYSYKCKDNGSSVLTIYPNGTVTNWADADSTGFIQDLSHIQDDTQVACIKYVDSAVDNGSEIYTRRLYNYKIFRSDTGQTSNSWIAIYASCGAGILVLLILACTCRMFFNKHRKRGTSSETDNENHEYVEIGLSQPSIDAPEYNYIYDHRSPASDRTGNTFRLCFSFVTI